MAQCAKWRYLIENEKLPSLHKAVYDGHIENIQDLLQSIGVDTHGTLNEICENMTPLDIAVAIQNEDIVELLLEQPDIEVNLQPGQDYPPLTRATWLPSTTIVKSLLACRDMDINKHGGSVDTPLYAACYDGQASNMRALLNRDDVKTDYMDVYNRTMSHGACEQGHVECLRVLVEYGLFELKAIAKNGLNPIENACKDNQMNIVRYFVENIELVAPGLDINSAEGQLFLCKCIKQASIRGHAGIISYLMKYVVWNIKLEELYEYVQVSLRRNKFITAKLLLSELSNLIATDNTIISCRLVEQLWSDTVKTDNGSILRQIYKLWAMVSNKFAGSEDEHFGQLAKSYDVDKQTKEDKILEVLCHAIRLGIPDQVCFLLQHTSEFLPKNWFRRIEDKTGINPFFLAAKYPAVSKLLTKFEYNVDSVDINEHEIWYRDTKSFSSRLSTESRVVTKSKTVQAMVEIQQKMSENDERREYVKTVVCDTVHKIAQEVSKRNPLLSIEPILVGSQKENTRPLFPNEFDFLLVLTTLQTFFQITQSCLVLMGGEVKVKEDLPNQPTDLPLLNDKRNIDHFRVLRELKALVIEAVRFLIKEKGFHKCIHFQSNFYLENNVPSIAFSWRGPVFKDMEIKIDLVPSLEFPGFQMPYSLPLDNCKYYVIIKQIMYMEKGVFQYPVAVNDAEAKLLEILPRDAKEGFRFAKALRVAHLFPSELLLLLQYETTYLEDYLTTYLLKTALFSFVLCPDSKLQNLHPYQWTFLIFKHLELRLIKGVLPNFFGTPRSCFMPPGRFDDILHCTEPLSDAMTSERECCIKRTRLLKVTRWIVEIVEEFCSREVEAFDSTQLSVLAEQAADAKPMIDREWYEYAIRY